LVQFRSRRDESEGRPAHRLENQYEKERAAVLSPVVLQVFRGKSLRTIGDAAAIYGKSQARTDDEWAPRSRR
jgi:hypothetical protein